MKEVIFILNFIKIIFLNNNEYSWVIFSESPTLTFNTGHFVNSITISNANFSDEPDYNSSIDNITNIYIEVYISDTVLNMDRVASMSFNINSNGGFSSLNVTDSIPSDDILTSSIKDKYIGLKLYAGNDNSGSFLGSTISDNETGTSIPYLCTFSNWYSQDNFTGPWEIRGNQVAGIYCLLKGTQILTPEGSKPIESLLKGDEIFNSSKKVKKIKSILYQKVKVDKSKKKEINTRININ